MKTLIKILISFTLIYTPFFAFASAAEKWTVQEAVYDDLAKNITYKAKKVGTPSNDFLYRAKVPVTSAATGSTVAAMLRYGAASAAIYALVEGVGWVIDNGAVVTKNPDEFPNNNHIQYLWSNSTSWSDSSSELNCKSVFRGSHTAVVNHFVDCAILNGMKEAFCELLDLTTYACTVIRKDGVRYNHYRVTRSSTQNPDYDPSIEIPSTPISPEDLGDLIHSSPQAPNILPDVYSPNNPYGPAPEITRKILDDAFPEPVVPPEADIKPNPNVDTDGDGIPDFYDPEQPTDGAKFEFPDFCIIAPIMCEWYTRYKDDSNKAEQHRQDEKSFWQKVEDWFDWTKEDPDFPEDEQSEIVDIPIPELNEDAIRWGSHCPADVQIPINLQGVSSTITFSWSPWCDLLALIKPAIIASAYIGAAFIVLGLRT